MMFLIFGVTPRERVLTVVAFVCEHCGTHATQHVIESASRLSIFFIPLLALSRRYFVVCSNCGGTTALTKDQAMHGVEWASHHREVS
jgi:hypothetical protein